MRAWFAPSSRARVECFFCTSRCLLVPPAPSRGALAKGKHRALDEHDGPVAVGSRDDFWCGQCGQINRRAQNGDILSDDAAHWDPALNRDSFDKRASTSRHRLPPSFPSPSTTPFCRQCLANQSLQLHLLASYPSSSDDEADESYPPLETYRQSLDQRYPLVCATRWDGG
ncbi:hypothetical protein Rhopal_002684-T1 [Rhodotorula paludigena]|uniref:Ima1 N-terminal domain-containing protein n=1 Tax=Rhodotorula paludigena TaxID=86838 RepID=A0AAV5GJZ1_9BASI|nr:hypothetical protein Rhopal_002684-T1 [Rhodotorula paludigena]